MQSLESFTNVKSTSLKDFSKYFEINRSKNLKVKFFLF